MMYGKVNEKMCGQKYKDCSDIFSENIEILDINFKINDVWKSI